MFLINGHKQESLAVSLLFLGTLGKILRAVNHNRPEALFSFVLAFPAQFVVSDTAAVI